MKKVQLKQFQKRILKSLIIRTLIFLCISALFLFTLVFSDFFEQKLNKNDVRFNTKILNSSFKVHFVDVGQGDCTVIELPDNKILMIDTGSAQVKKKVIRYLNNIVFKNRRDRTIDYLILTHTDMDHIGGAVAVLENFEAKNIYIPKVYSSFEVENGFKIYDYNVSTSSYWSDTTRAIRKEVSESHMFYNYEGLSISSTSEEDFKLDFYAPFREKFSKSNDYSPIILLEYLEFKFMFVGDIEKNIEQEFIQRYYEEVNAGFFDCSVFKVAHHGSSSSNSAEFLQAIEPEFSIISCSKFNTYNHPNDEVINRLCDLESEILRTDVMGSILIYISDGSLFSFFGYNFVTDLYFEWWCFVVGGIILSFCVISLAKQKD